MRFYSQEEKEDHFYFRSIDNKLSEDERYKYHILWLNELEKKIKTPEQNDKRTD